MRPSLKAPALNRSVPGGQLADTENCRLSNKNIFVTEEPVVLLQGDDQLGSLVFCFVLFLKKMGNFPFLLALLVHFIALLFKLQGMR